MAAGGNSHQRAKDKSSKHQLAKDIADSVVERLSQAAAAPTLRPALLSTKQWLPIASVLLAVVLALIGLQDVFPLWLNVVFYAAALLLFLYSCWKWETTALWSRGRKIWGAVLVVMIYGCFVAFPITKQYQREVNIKLTFKTSPELSWWRRLVITRDIYKFRDYLTSIGISVQPNVPPIAVSWTSGGGSVTPPSLPMYRSELLIGRGEVRDRRKVTESYANYEIELIIGKTLMRDRNITIFSKAMLSTLGIADYFSQSYWNEPPPPAERLPSVRLLWDIRNKEGAEFADLLAAAALNTLGDDPVVGDPNPNGVWVRALMIGDSVVESQCERWDDVRKILVDNGVHEEFIRSQDMSKASVSVACIEAWKK
ncbi:MAG: hypothetical protein WBQ76_07805 [Candidatus Korobacteraceae bacterium]